MAAVTVTQRTPRELEIGDQIVTDDQARTITAIEFAYGVADITLDTGDHIYQRTNTRLTVAATR